MLRAPSHPPPAPLTPVRTTAPTQAPPPLPGPPAELPPPKEKATGVLAWIGRAAETVVRALSFLWSLIFKPRLHAPLELDPTKAPAEPGVSAATTGNTLELLVDGDELYPALLDNIAAARQSIWLNVFEFQHEGTAAAVADALIAARARGVGVKLVVDNRKVPSELADGAPDNPLLRKLQAHGCEVRFNAHDGFSVNHRKLVVFDGRKALVMGANIGGNYLLPLKEGWTYHDASVLVAGPAVRDVASVFAESWRATGGRPLALPTRLPPIPKAEAGAVQVVSHRGGEDRNIERELVQRIDAEPRDGRVVLVNGFGMSRAIRKALLRARKRGVDVTWIFGSASSQSSLMAQSSFDELRRAGVKIARHPRPLHMKAYAFGDDKLVIGSSNLDGFSTWSNDEAVLQITSRAFVAKFFARVVTPDLKISTPVAGDVVKASTLTDHLIENVLEWLVD